MQKVIFDVMRHGLKDGDNLTAEGRKQVVASTKHNLQGILYDAAFHAGTNRALQTVASALETLGRQLGVVPPVKEEGFGYEWAAGKDFLPLKEALKEVETRKAAGEQETAGLWLRISPTCHAIRGRFLATLLFRALLLAQERNKDEYRVLVGSHSPTGELAALDPETTPRLREADIIRYVVEVNAMETKLISSEVLRAPY